MDEQQLEVSKSLVKWKKFEDEPSDKEFQPANDGWYGPVEKAGASWLWSSVVMQAYQDATKEVSDIFKLNVPLGIDPAIGLNWRDCH